MIELVLLGILAVVIAVWFFKSARTVGKSGLWWAVVGAFSIAVPWRAWTFAAQHAIVAAKLRMTMETLFLVLIGLSAVGLLIGLSFTFWVHSRNLGLKALKEANNRRRRSA